MNLKTVLRGGGATVLIAAMALTSLPASAQGGGWVQRAQEASRQQQQPQQARPQRQQQQPQARPQRQQQQQRAQAVEQRGPVAQERGSRGSNRGDRSGRDWNRSDRSGSDWNRSDRSGRDWNRGDRRSDTGATRSGRDWSRSQQEQRAQQQVGQRQGWIGRSIEQQQRNRSYRDDRRNSTYRDGYRDGRGGNYRDGSHYRDRDNRSWSRDWRRDNRYNWYSYRNQYRDRYRLGRYYAPYSNYRYNRLSIGFFLGSGFYSSRYWINDPWQYRLPPAYSGYRWVRYYDDALLVDTYSGEVVDVIHDFFW